MGMDDLRSMSYGGGGSNTERTRTTSQPELYYEGSGYTASTNERPSNLHDLRCYSASYATGSPHHHTDNPPPPIQYPRKGGELKKGKSTNGSISRAWCFSDPELQRKRRVASYKVYTAEGKMKGSLRKSFRWVKDIIHGGWR